MLPNRTEHVLADLGARARGRRPGHLLRHARRGAGRLRRRRLRRADRGAGRRRPNWPAGSRSSASLPGLDKIIVRDAGRLPGRGPVPDLGRLRRAGPRAATPPMPELVTARMAAISPEDPVTLLYTSGTTGNPKGVLLTHRNVLYEVAAAERGRQHARRGVRWVSYLPLAHIAERMFSIYLPISTAGTSTSARTPAQLDRCGRGGPGRPRSSACPGCGRRCGPASRRC